jgi:transcriptional regulator with XRE-family HTH domain
MELGRWVKARRAALGMTQEQVWQRMELDIDQNFLAHLESGRKKSLPDTPVLIALSGALNVTVTEVLRGAGILPVDVEQPPEHAPGSATMHALVDLIDWTTNPANRENVEGLLRLILERQQAATSGRAPAGSRSS